MSTNDETRQFPPEGGVQSPELLIGSILAGRYRIESLLGVGAMGIVYLGQHLKIGRKDAIKVLHGKDAFDPEAIARFVRGARNVSQIRHPNVCTIYDFSETGEGLQFLAMEFVPGETLKTLLDRVGTLPVERSLHIAEQVAAALHAAHHAGIVHRDLKPANIMIEAGRDSKDVVKVVDFDISKGAREGLDPELTRTGFVIGTPQFMSPEQLMGIELDGRSDIYSLGLVLCHMLTGQSPFRSGSMQERLREQPPSALNELFPRPQFPPALVTLITQALQRWPEHRPATAGEFAEQLRELREELARRRGVGLGINVKRLALPAAGVLLTVSVALGSWSMINRDGDSTKSSDTGPITATTELPPQEPPPEEPKKPAPAATPAVRLRVRSDNLSDDVARAVATAVSKIQGAVLDTESANPDLTFASTNGADVVADGILGQERLAGVDAAALGRILRRDFALALLGSAGADRRLALELAGGKTTYVLDEEVGFVIRPARAGYLTLISVGPDGSLTVLHPMRDFELGKLNAGESVTIPRAGDPTFPASPPTGNGAMLAFITDAKLPVLRGGEDYRTWTDGVAGAREIVRLVKRAGTTPSISQIARYTIRR